MRVKDIMTRGVISVAPQATVAQALDVMARSHVSGLPVIDSSQTLVGIVSEADFLRRPEIGTLKNNAPWYESFFMPGRSAEIYAHTHGRRVDEVMTSEVATIGEDASLDEAIARMRSSRVKRLPVVDGGKVIGIVTRSDFVRALALFVREPYDEDLTTDAAIKRAIEAELRAQSWAPIASVEIEVKDGVVTLRGALSDERQRMAVRTVAENVNGVLAVHDHTALVEPYLMTPLL
jgi:CBS domain-containing protein